MAMYTYKRRFALDGRRCEARIAAGMDGLTSTLLIDGEERARDFTPAGGPEAVRNHRLATRLADGSELEVVAGYRNLFDIGIAVRRDGALVHESHPGATLAYPRAMVGMTRKMTAANPEQWRRNRLPMAVDVASGVFFYVVAKTTDLTTAALAGAALAIALVIAEKLLEKDLTGGLVLFGVAMSLTAAALAFAFQSDEAVKWRSSVVGMIAALAFFADGLIHRGRWLGKGLGRYLPFPVDHRRIALGLGAAGLAMAALNVVALRALSTDAWLVYHSFLDTFVAMGLAVAAMVWAREREAMLPAPAAPG